MIHDYTINITREQFELIHEDLESRRKTTRSRTVDLYEVCFVQAENGSYAYLLSIDYGKCN
ncbi:hypothetical protein CN553_28035 [Bacillus cereus]|uniref:Uncharacterized protein n=1 Tax=Bacillus cereus TaxID=1396 RepID=A0A9X6U6G9_BACCE|nr:hypothetical protein [Bacillus cereus]PEN83256.1 hypothetical protein CN553_28035 [Bacillus cereus]